jgi:ParB family chromosome partitioning protein
MAFQERAARDLAAVGIRTWIKTMTSLPTDRGKSPGRASAAQLVQRAKKALVASNVSSWDAADCFVALYRRGWTQQQIARACETTQPTVSRFIAFAKRYAVPHNRPSFWQAYRQIGGKAHVSWATGQPEWYTPPEFLAAARDVLGSIDLDPASCDKAQQAVQAARYFTAQEDGLGQPWRGKVWLNPPFRQVDRFAAKLCEAHRSGAVPEAVLLVNNATETAWFQDTARMASALCLPLGRIRFLDHSGTPQQQPLQGQAILYFGPDAQRFIDRFTPFGLCFACKRLA